MLFETNESCIIYTLMMCINWNEGNRSKVYAHSSLSIHIVSKFHIKFVFRSNNRYCWALFRGKAAKCRTPEKFELFSPNAHEKDGMWSLMPMKQII